MKIRHFALILLLFSVFSAFADKKMTIRNAETGESLEVSVPDGLKIYEYNSNWLDSIPYLLERARYGEPWAHEALGDCYRYGKGGVEESIFNALVYYGLSGINVDEMAMKAVKENPKEHLGLVYKLIDKVEAGDNDGIYCMLDTLNQEHYTEADILRDIITDADTLSLTPVIERNVLSPEVSTDKMIFTLAACRYNNWLPASFSDKEGLSFALSLKFPFLCDRIAVKFFGEDHEDMDSVNIAEKTVKAIRFLEKADKEAMLSREGASILYKHYVSEVEAGRMSIDAEEMERLAILARLPECETFIFTDK